MTQIGHTTDFPLRLMPQKIYTLARPGKEQKTLSRDGRGEGSKVQTVGRDYGGDEKVGEKMIGWRVDDDAFTTPGGGWHGRENNFL